MWLRVPRCLAASEPVTPHCLLFTLDECAPSLLHWSFSVQVQPGCAGGWGEGGEEGLDPTLNCHHQNDTCMKIGRCVRHVNGVSQTNIGAVSKGNDGDTSERQGGVHIGFTSA